ncbi:MAG: MATE family efflux transporter [Treponema sp.]|nr:MATE family efflux transporter [Treponema sp.]
MTRHLTEGKPFALILQFSIPVLLGYLFQQFYNVTDTVIVGKLLGFRSLAAVGSTGAVNFLIIGFAAGLCTGFTIPVSQRFGAQDYTSMRRYVCNAAYLSVCFSLLMALLTVFFCRPLLRIMKTPDDIISEATAYIRIIFAGIPTIFLYNMTAGTIRALGDSKTPVYFLVASSVLNITLDLVFIMVCKWGIQGAAYATVISQGISGAACLFYMARKFEILICSGNEKQFSCRHSLSLLSVGIPMGLQYSITAIGSVIMQTAINTLGSAAVAAVTASYRVSGFFCTVFDALGTTMATYGGQNTGARKFERLGEGIRDSMLIGTVYSAVVFAVYFFFGQHVLRLFINGPELNIIHDAKLFLLEISSCYVFLAGVNIIRFMIQGMGFSMFAILSGVFEMTARTLAGIWIIPRFGFISAGLADPLAWIFADLFLVPAFLLCRRHLYKKYTGTEHIQQPAHAAIRPADNA